MYADSGRIGRVIVLVIDGLGVGAMPDVAEVRPRDVGADTLGHVVKAAGGPSLPNLARAITSRAVRARRVISHD